MKPPYSIVHCYTSASQSVVKILYKALCISTVARRKMVEKSALPYTYYARKKEENNVSS